jgi:hypothetical protein
MGNLTFLVLGKGSMHVKGYVQGRKPRVENLSTLSKTTMYKVWCTRGEEGMHGSIF